ncbi:MAG: hypothetical protein MUF70_05420 [Myxococcota bacterium]|jgi:hypothetical protein|nr:hypothetical protein [Myxococcota bacterium]
MHARRLAASLAAPILLAIAISLAPGEANAATRLRAVTLSDPLDGVSEFRPRIAGDTVVWQRGSGTGAEVMRWDGTQAVNMSNNGVADENPETDGIHIVWQQGSAPNRDIAIYDLVTRTSTILSSLGDEVFPLISGPYLAWIKMVDADGEVFVDPGPIGDQVTGDLLVHSSFQMDGANVVWSQGDDLGQTPGLTDDLHDIAVWNGELQGFFVLTGIDTDDIKPVIANDVVVWQAGPDGSGDIWYGDTVGTSNLLFDGSDERNPDTDGTRAVWQHWDGLDFDLFLVNLASPNAAVPFTNDAFDDVTPQIDGTKVVWVKEVTPGDSEIWFSWDGAPPEPLRASQNNGRDDVAPRLDGDSFVYESCLNLGEPSEICDVVRVPEPRGELLGALACVAMAFLLARTRRS